MVRSYGTDGRQRTARMKPTVRGCVYAAALLALWTAPGFVHAQSLADGSAHSAANITADSPPSAGDTAPVPRGVAVVDDGKDDVDDDEFPEPPDEPTSGPTLSTPTESPTTTEPTTTEPTPTDPTPTEPPLSPKPTASTASPNPAPTPPEMPSPTPTTISPAIRTDPPNPTPTTSTTNTDISNNNALPHGHSASVGVNPMLMVGMVAFCAVFLVVWSRRRRGGGEEGGGADASSSSMSGMATTSSTEKSGADGKKVQYSRIENRPEEEDAEFGGRNGSWDDWENSGGQNQSHCINVSKDEDDYDQEDAYGDDAKLTKGLSSSSSSSSVAPQSPPRSGRGSVRMSTAGVKLTPPPPPPPLSSGSQQLQHDRLKEIVQSEVTQPKATSVASNSSSNESFEVVAPPVTTTYDHQPPLDLLSGSLTPPKTQLATPAPPATEDDLFSQFGMVPTFTKGVQQTPTPVAPSSTTMRAPPSLHSTATTALNPFAASPPPSSSSISASSLFAADLEDVSVGIADASNEWGEEDDDWVQGL